MSDTTHRCPNEIAEIFDTDPRAGREKAIEWAASLSLKPGDRVWLPEIGWHIFQDGSDTDV